MTKDFTPLQKMQMEEFFRNASACDWNPFYDRNGNEVSIEVISGFFLNTKQCTLLLDAYCKQELWEAFFLL
jgi:hypothetical protein